MNTALFASDGPEPTDPGDRLQDQIEAEAFDYDQFIEISDVAAHDLGVFTRAVTEVLANQQDPAKIVEILAGMHVTLLNLMGAFDTLAEGVDTYPTLATRHTDRFPAMVRDQLPTGLRPFLQLGAVGLTAHGHKHLTDVLALMAELTGLATAITGGPYRQPETENTIALRAGLTQVLDAVRAVTTLAATVTAAEVGGTAR